MTSEVIDRTLSLVLNEMKGPEWVLSSRVIEADFCLFVCSTKFTMSSVLRNDKREKSHRAEQARRNYYKHPRKRR